MSSLINFLSRFSTATLQRSLSYAKHIDRETIEFFEEKDGVTMYAQIEGTDYYDTAITYNPQKDRLIDDDCTCPVGYNCKHAAALARLFFQEYRQEFQQCYADSQSPQGIAKRQRGDDQAQRWLNDFKRYLQQTEPEQSVKTNNYLIYLLDQSVSLKKLTVDVQKARRNKNGSIAGESYYTQYENITRKHLTLPEQKRQLFNQIYYYAKINSDERFYQSNLDISSISLEHFKSFIQSGDVYWQKKSHTALQWSEQGYNIEFRWEQGVNKQTEHLNIELVNGDIRLDLKSNPHIQILASHPPCYVDIQQNTVGQLYGEYTANLLYHFLQMPDLPSTLMPEFEKLTHQYSDVQNLPQPESIQHIDVLEGSPQPILRFGVLDTFDWKWVESVCAEIEFSYAGGRIKAGTSGDSFIGEQHGKMVRQLRDLVQEQQSIQRLQLLVESLKWVKDLSYDHQLKLDKQRLDSMVFAFYGDWIKQLMPINQIELMGWQIEHLKNSPFNLQYVENLNISITESEGQQDWFNIGATVQDGAGNSYNLLDALVALVRVNPDLLDPRTFSHLHDSQIFTVKTAVDQPDLALSARDIKPVLLHLQSILQQEERSIDRYDASQLLELQHNLGMTWQVSDRLQQFVQKFKQGYQQQLPTPQGFQGKLRPYQQQGLGWLQFLRETQHGGILADDMGLGKTAQTLAHLLMEKQAGHLQERPALIVAPTSLMHNWFKEAEKFTPQLKVLLLQGPDRHQYFEQIPHYDIVLTTYPLLARDEEQLKQYEYHQLILDEAQNIKNPRAKAAQVVRQLTARHRLCLTGTPMENHLGELWALFYFLMPGFLYSQEIFNKKYRHPIEKRGDQQLRQKLVNRIKPFILRRLKTDVAKELPEKTTIEVNIDMNDQQSKLYEAVRATMQASIQKIVAEKGFKRSQIQILDALLKLRQVCCHPSLLRLDSVKIGQANSAKLEQLMDMVVPMVEEGRKILIFSQFTSMLELIEQQLHHAEIGYVKLTGKTKKRDEVITAFQSGQVPVFLISLKAGGVGLNLTAADTVIHYDPWWNPAAEDQASDRAWRIGQDKPVFVYKLITNKSIEEKILALQQNKAELAHSILSTDHEGEVKLTENDVMNLFEKF